MKQGMTKGTNVPVKKAATEEAITPSPQTVVAHSAHTSTIQRDTLGLRARLFAS